MSDIKWIKITTDMFEHEKLDFIMSLPESDAIIVVWIRLLALAGKVNVGGYVLLTENIPYTEEMLAHKFRKPLNVVRLALETLKRLKMIVSEGDTLLIANWDKHQNVEGMEKIRKQNQLRQRKKREKDRTLLLQNDDVSRDSHVTVTEDVTLSNATDIELELDIKNNIYTEIRDDVKFIFKHWNEKKIMKHRELTDVMKSKINARLESRTTDEIITAIDNYHAIITDNDTYWYTAKFTLQEFMNPKNLDRFLTENRPFETHRKNVVQFKNDKTAIDPQIEARHRDIALNRWISNGGDPNDFKYDPGA